MGFKGAACLGAVLSCLTGTAMADPHPMWLPGHFPHTPSTGATGEMDYYGGPVFSNVKVITVMWGTKVNPQIVAGIGGFYTAATNSTFFDIMAQYATTLTGINGHKGTNQQINRGTFSEQVVITPFNKKTTLTDKAIQKELVKQIAAGKLPVPDVNTLYMAYFPPGITIKLGSAQSCSTFGAYHSAFSNATYGGVFYGVMPDCGYTFADSTVVSSHELAEATTDNFPTPGTHPKYPQAWNTTDGYEIGDLCEGYSGMLTAGSTTYTVQQIYSNLTAGCSTGNYHSP
jgi:hypothetical protein